eukprot:EG_transcript_13955
MNWVELGSCGGETQSPINISTSEALKDGTVRHLTLFQPLGSSCSGCTTEKNDHGIQILMDDCKVILKSDWVTGPYYLMQMHMHTPSEHWVDGESSEMELHIVFKHATLDFDYLVIAVLYRIGHESALLEPLVRSLSSLSEEGARAHLKRFKFDYDTDQKAYYEYIGSLTTPPCTERVRWLVQVEPWTMSASQYQALDTAMRAQHAGKDTARPTQPLNGRQVTRRDVRSCRSEPDGYLCLLSQYGISEGPKWQSYLPLAAALSMAGLSAALALAALRGRRRRYEAIDNVSTASGSSV